MRLADQFKGRSSPPCCKEVVIDGEHLAIEAQFDDGGPFERGEYRRWWPVQYPVPLFCFQALVAKHASLLLGRVALILLFIHFIILVILFHGG